ncbi:MAG: glycosyltransferase family 2 protein [Clostridia bacterium]|nr:glycosyltransferase family 2 protein [Clostridia bacterium]
MPEITVVITAYNLERFLPVCLDGLRAQTFQDFDVVIVNDCSTDRTAEIAAGFAAQEGERVHLLSTPQNLGRPGRARNFALDSGLVTGKYVIFLDGDDETEPTFFEKLYNAAQQNDAQIALCAYDRFEDGTGHVLCEEMHGFPAVIDLPAADDVLAFLNGSLWNKLIRTELIGDTRIPDFSAGEDLSFSAALYMRCSRIVCVDEVLFHYRVRPGSVIAGTSAETIRAFAHACAALLNSCKDDSAMYETVALTTFIHIGISMAMRAWDNPDVPTRDMLREIRTFLRDQSILRGRRYLRLSSLLRHGVRGMAIWVCKWCTRLHCMNMFLGAYNFFKRIFHIDVKF